MTIKAVNGIEGTSVPSVLPQWRMKRVLDLVGGNIGRTLTVSKLSAAAGLSDRHFARSFSATHGKTPHRWLIEHRLERARQLIAETELPLGEIATICGFCSQSHMTSAMRAEHSVTPARWRTISRREF